MTIVNIFEKSNKDEIIEAGDIVCTDDNGLMRKIECESDLFRFTGVVAELSDCNEKMLEEINKDNKIPVGLAGTIYVKTNEKDIISGDSLVTNLDSTARVRNAGDDDCDIIGIALKKPENGKVLIKIK